MKLTGSNAAYDLSLFEEKPKIQKQNKNELKVIKSTHKSKMNGKSLVQGTLLTILLVSITMVMLYSKLTLNEITAQINYATKSYDELLSEKTRLDMELESKVSLKNVEELAETELGLNKITSQQIEYVQVANSNGVTTSQSNNQFDLFETIKEGISNFLAYIQQ